MRFRYGLSIEPPFSPSTPSSVCVSQRSSSEKRGGSNFGCCAAPLDPKGRHAVTCHVGGKTIRRHDLIVHRLAELLKPFVISCTTEVYVHELEQIYPETGEWTETKLDLDLLTSAGRFLLDVSVFHPFQNPRKEKFRHVKLSERERKTYERYPLHKDGRRVTDAALVPIILNTFGAVGDKAAEFFYSLAGAKAKGICDEISLLSVFQSAEMILQSHAPSNLSNLLSISKRSEKVFDAHADLNVRAGEQSFQPTAQLAEKDVENSAESGFLRPDLRGEVKGNQVQCLGCSTQTKKVFRAALAWNWNRHVKLKHCPQSVLQSLPRQDDQPAAGIPQQPDVRPAQQQAQAARTVSKLAGKEDGRSKGQKQQGPIVPTSVRAKPSKTHGSQELQAGSRANQEPAISTSADVQKSGRRSSKVSIGNASIDK